MSTEPQDTNEPNPPPEPDAYEAPVEDEAAADFGAPETAEEDV